MKYIRHSRRNPVDSLNIIVGILKNPSPTTKPFAELDALYAHILHPPDTDLSLIRRILHITITLTKLGQGSYLVPSFFDGFLELPPGTTATALCDLHSILHIPESANKPIKFHHKSLEDYLLDRERSLDFFQSPYETQLDIATCCATHLTRWGSNPTVNNSHYISYSAHFWRDHLLFCIDQQPVSTTLPKVITDLDPRNSAIYFFIHGLDSHDFWGRHAETFHVALCSEQHCVRICQLLTRVTKCMDKCDTFKAAFRPDDVEDPDSRKVFGRKCGNPSVISASRLMPGGGGSVLALAPRQTSSSSSSNVVGGLRGRPLQPAIANLSALSVRQPVISPWTFSFSFSPFPSSSSSHPPVGGPGGSVHFLASQMASSMEAHGSAVVSKKRPYEGVEAGPNKWRQGNGDANARM